MNYACAKCFVIREIGAVINLFNFRLCQIEIKCLNNLKMLKKYAILVF